MKNNTPHRVHNTCALGAGPTGHTPAALRPPAVLPLGLLLSSRWGPSASAAPGRVVFFLSIQPSHHSATSPVSVLLGTRELVSGRLFASLSPPPAHLPPPGTQPLEPRRALEADENKRPDSGAARTFHICVPPPRSPGLLQAPGPAGRAPAPWPWPAAGPPLRLVIAE